MKQVREIITESQNYIARVFPNSGAMPPEQRICLTECYIMAYLSGAQDCGGGEECLKRRAEVKLYMDALVAQFVKKQG